MLYGRTGSFLSYAKQGAFYRALQPNGASEGRERQLYRRREDA